MSDRLTTAEVAAMLRVTPRTLKRWRKEEVGPSYVRVETRIFYEVSDIEEYLAARKVKTHA